jgi:hypothetical protein
VDCQDLCLSGWPRREFCQRGKQPILLQRRLDSVQPRGVLDMAWLVVQFMAWVGDDCGCHIMGCI